MYYRPIPQQKKQAPRKSDFKKFDAPIAGWISNRSLSSPIANGEAQGAAILDNFFPSATTAVLRRGKELYATLGFGELPVTSIFSYMNGLNRKLFASTPETIYDITSILTPFSWRLVDAQNSYIVTENGDTFGVPSTEGKEVFENTLGGNWVVVQFATTGGIYLVGVNGESTGFIYDGFVFYPYIEGGVFALSYDEVVTDFQVGETITGETSLATGVIIDVLPGGGLVIKDIVADPEQWEISFVDGDGELVAGNSITGEQSRASATVVGVVSTKDWDLPYYQVVTPFSVGDTVTGGTSSATATIDSINVGPDQWILEIDNGIYPFDIGEVITGITSSATGKIVRVEDPEIQYNLSFDAGTAGFAAGTTIIGGTSNARAEIISVSGTTAVGTLVIKNMVGVFSDNEIITGDIGGSATVNGSASGAFIAGRLILEGVTGVFVDNEVIKGSDKGNASANGSSSGPFASGTMNVSGLVGDFIAMEPISGIDGGSAKAVSEQSDPIYSGTLTIESLFGTFIGGEELTATGGVKATSSSTEVYIGGGGFRDNERITGNLGGDALASSDYVNIVPGITFPDSLTTADMSYVWVYKNRLWFVQKDSLQVWYMDNGDSIGGEPVKYPLGGILGRGGHVIWGAAWSLDSGASGGLSDQLVITSSEGEVVVFQGVYPEDVTSWQQVGVYRIGTPLGNRAHFRGGGDIVVATSVGLVPLSKAISLDVTALSQAAISYNIQDAWQNGVNERGFNDWQCELWPELKMAIISPPSPVGAHDPVLFVSNTETGAWCRYTNWDARAMDVFQGELYFGGPNGEVYKANVTGSDDGATYTGVYIPLFEDLGTPANVKIPKVGRGVSRAKSPVTYTLRFQGDFNMDEGAAPTATSVFEGNSWGGGTWGQSTWGSPESNIITQDWKSLGGMGYSTSLSYQVTSGSLSPLDAEIIRLEMTFTTAEVVS